MRRHRQKRFMYLALAVLMGISAAGLVPITVRAASWDVEAASKKAGVHQKKPYTIMVYMNGSDLESEGGAATDDLIEMLESGLDGRNAHLIVFTGGANRWQNNVVPANDCVVWEIEDGWMYEVAGVGQVNMGDPGTLSGFIQYGLTNYPADRYGLIMWDHGGGSIAGYGHDEKFIEGNLTLADMQAAFEEAGLKHNKLEFLGFDSCLMATVEMALIASDYANYLIASEDLEPGGGWDYYFLSLLNQNAEVDGKTVGTAVVDSFMRYYGPDSDEILSLSVIDLSKTDPVMTAMGQLMIPCSNSLVQNRALSFRTLAGKRNRTKTFGEGTPRDNECDMVDIGDMAVKLSDLYPEEAANVLAALDQCVVYTRHNSDIDLRGLSTYYIYGGKAVGMPALETYASLGMNADYTQYLYRFFDALVSPANVASVRNRSRQSGEPLSSDDITRTELVLWQPIGNTTGRYRMAGLAQTDRQNSETKNLLWPKLNGHSVCLHPVNRTAQNEWYAIPAQLNGRDCDLIVLFNDRHPDGLVEGARNNEGIIIQKGYDPVKPGDSVVIYYMEHNFNKRSSGEEPSDIKWRESVAFKVKDELRLTWEPAGNNTCMGLRLTDINNTISYTPFVFESILPAKAS